MDCYGLTTLQSYVHTWIKFIINNCTICVVLNLLVVDEVTSSCTVMHHLDNQGCFETALSSFATGMVLRMPAHLATMWQWNVAMLFL